MAVALTAARFFGPQLALAGLAAPLLTVRPAQGGEGQGRARASARVTGQPLFDELRSAGITQGPFSALVDRHVKNPWLRRFLDLECFVLSGMLAKDTISAEMAFMFAERGGGKPIDYPMGGSEALIQALVRGLEKNGGRLILRSHVDQVLMEGGRAAGVMLRPRPGAASSRPEVIRARRAVVSNASCWDTQRLLPPGVGDPQWRAQSAATPVLGSFMHLHLGIDATGLDPELQCHHLFVGDWCDLEAPQNVRIASIPTVFDANLAPPGHAVVHAYTAANEPYSLWEGLDRRSKEYKALKEERMAPLWGALEHAIPDIRDRAALVLEGTPLTHERFLRRHRGSYGPGISARNGTFPGPNTPVPGLYAAGDSCMPGIGVPAAAASGLITAHTLVPFWSQIKAMDVMAL